jgi:uncharacterized protein
MKIIISDIPIEGLDLDILEIIELEEASTPARAQIMVKKMGTEISIKGKMSVKAKLICSRCLCEYYKELVIPIDVIYHPLEELKGEEIYELKTEELDMDFYSDGEIDLNILLKEQIVLNLPMKPLCNESCKGICIRCGADLNKGDCGCEKSFIDSRFEKLRILLSNYHN